MTTTELVQAVGKCYGIKVTKDEAGYIAWNYTGYPMFWNTDRPREEFRMQVAAYLRGERSCARCSTRMDPGGETRWGVCITCALEMGWVNA